MHAVTPRAATFESRIAFTGLTFAQSNAATAAGIAWGVPARLVADLTLSTVGPHAVAADFQSVAQRLHEAFITAYEQQTTTLSAAKAWQSAIATVAGSGLSESDATGFLADAGPDLGPTRAEMYPPGVSS